ncbi:Phosphoserine phosphatase [Pseudocercospora fuligena]|uniref:phosphoserine phosphatase n=1 Tax=Pseudocercospora fuligena TaxID=685502 RepID=A0A8H6RNH7_9PEZI|nr:Phosphoserine phosphatase [Pseudocercospora fuligena]
MSTSTSSELIALIFAHTENLEPQTWQNIFDRITSSLQNSFSDLDGPASPVTRFLEKGRVAELRLPSTTSPSLRECKNWTDGEELQAFQTSHNVEIVLQPGSLYTSHQRKGLMVFDMDSTLIQQEVIDELARAVGRYEAVSQITEAAMRGEEPYTDFEASLRARVGLLKGVPTTIWRDLREKGIITFAPGGKELVQFLRGKGWKTAVLSGGFTPLAEWVKETLGLDHCFANFLVEEGGVLTGELVQGKPIIHGEKKRELLLEIAGMEGVEKESCVAVGDGSNDLLMMEAAGLGVAFNAKPKVQKAAPTRLNSKSLLDVAYILGYTKEEVDQALA